MDVRYSSSLLVLFVQQVLWQAGPRSPTTSSASPQGTCTSKPRLYGAPLTALGRSEEKPPAKREWPRMNRLQHLLVPFQRAAPRNLRNRPKNSRTESEKVLARIVRRYTPVLPISQQVIRVAQTRISLGVVRVLVDCLLEISHGDLQTVRRSFVPEVARFEIGLVSLRINNFRLL